MVAVFENTNVDTIEKPVVVIGTGPVGVRTVQEVLRREPLAHVVVYGNEPWDPYNRVKLSSLLSGELSYEEIDNSLVIAKSSKVSQHHNCSVVKIDRQRKVIVDETGREQPYKKVFIATGSRARIPDVEGIDLPGVYTFRDLNDVQALIARQTRTQKLLVIGGGLLGLEAARAMQRGNTQVTVLDHNPRLMYRQLDETAGSLLAKKVNDLGIEVIAGDHVKAIEGDGRVEKVIFTHAGERPFDSVIVAAGIIPNVDLARDAQLSVSKGVVVNDNMQTSDPDIYAVGECAEHRGQVYGIVAPGYEQAAVAAHHMLVEPTSYEGSISATRLKVVGETVFSMGSVGEMEDSVFDQPHVYFDKENGVYRKLVTRNNRLVGAVAIGAWPELNRVQEAVLKGRKVWFWELWRFKKTGLLWGEESESPVTEWPSKAIVCQCMNVNRGTLSSAVISGCSSSEALGKRCGAGTVCGSCKPLLEQLVNETNTLGEEKKKALPKFLLGLSLVSLIVSALIMFMPGVPFSNSVQEFSFDRFWTDGLIKQITGFTLLGLTVIGLVVSARKRLKWFKWGDYNNWRLVHIVLGVMILTTLWFHTGMYLGVNLNQMLMVNFLLAAAVGAGAGLITSFSTRMTPVKAMRRRKWFNYLHLVVTWPLPTLLIFHILSVYYF